MKGPEYGHLLWGENDVKRKGRRKNNSRTNYRIKVSDKCLGKMIKNWVDKDGTFSMFWKTKVLFLFLFTSSSLAPWKKYLWLCHNNIVNNPWGL